MSMSAGDLAAVVTGRTRVRYTSGDGGDCGVVIGPLPDGLGQRATANLLVQFDGEFTPCSVSSSLLELAD